MSIPERLADAQLLLRHRRNEGALLCVLVAVGATARKRYPRGTKSAIDASKRMEDCEAYCTFLEDEFKRNKVTRMHCLMDEPDSPMPPLPTERLEIPPSPLLGDDIEAYFKAEREWEADFKARYEAYHKRLDDQHRELKEWGERQTLMPMELIFYKLCRCGLCHDAELDPRVSFVDVDAPGLRTEFKNQHLRLGGRWIARLATFVIGAPENAHLFSNDAKLFWQDALTAADKDPEHGVSPQLTHERT